MPFNTANATLPAPSVAVDTRTAWLTGREYLRVSQDSSGRQRSVTEQHDDNERTTVRHSIKITGEPYVDNDRSASRYASKARDDWARLVADLESGAFTEDVLILWENSRYSRKTSEWLHLMELCEERGKRIFITSDNRLYDLSHWKDRRNLREDASDSETESDKVSMRNRRTSAAQAEQGRPNARPPHGYMAQYDEQTGKLINWVENPEESEVPKALFKGLREGKSYRRIARELAAAGHVNRSGRPFTDEHLRSMALRPAYGGYRKHTPKSRGRTFQAQQVETNLYEATWAPLVDRETFWAVRRTLLDPARRSTRNGKAKHALTMIIRCDVCGGTMGAAGEGTSAYYFCRERRCVQINKPAVDALIIGSPTHPGVILAYLASDKVYEDFAASAQDSGKVEHLRAEIERLRGERSEAENAEPESVAEARMFARMVETLTTKITALEEQERRLTLPAVLTDLIRPGKDVVKRWEAAPVEARREVARLLLSADWLGQVRIRRGRGVPAADRIHWHQEPACEACTAA
ncbi:recombinase family protein [Streptomyces spinoverrucosus]|uniref:recombinase family protein n=1 Tax=Streptomyces spinoverrucosus TaxID=284043 RepID=UPI0018C3FE5C|nr:recombinase family protein [Streptomyces spinoverrucosus]MBG0853814.1 recombinase family protein [Streptomyces spinoverrucosus]